MDDRLTSKVEIIRPPKWAVDTSVAIPLVMANHPNHAAVAAKVGTRKVHLSGHALAETYSALTRMPKVDLSADEVAEVIDYSFAEPLLLRAETYAKVHRELARLGISGGAVYDALVGLAAKENHATLLTMDTRASATYDALGVKVEMITVAR